MAWLHSNRRPSQAGVQVRYPVGGFAGRHKGVTCLVVTGRTSRRPGAGHLLAAERRAFRAHESRQSRCVLVWVNPRQRLADLAAGASTAPCAGFVAEHQSNERRTLRGWRSIRFTQRRTRPRLQRLPVTSPSQGAVVLWRWRGRSFHSRSACLRRLGTQERRRGAPRCRAVRTSPSGRRTSWQLRPVPGRRSHASPCRQGGTAGAQFSGTTYGRRQIQ